MSSFETPRGSLEHTLDHALSRTFRPPHVPHDFRRRLQAARSRAEETDLAELRLRLESERRSDLATLEARYVRLRRRTLGIIIAAAFMGGALVALAMPWLEKHVAEAAPLIPSSVGAAMGLAIAYMSWRAHARDGAR